MRVAPDLEDFPAPGETLTRAVVHWLIHAVRRGGSGFAPAFEA